MDKQNNKKYTLKTRMSFLAGFVLTIQDTNYCNYYID